jgi:hypothetical protein
MVLRALNTEELRQEIVVRLPVRSRWLLHDAPWDWDFSRATRSLEPLSDEDAQTLIELLPRDWRQLLIFGEQQFAQHGGASPFVSVHGQTGEVFGLDLEREHAVAFPLNSSISAFIRTFLLFNDALEAGGAMPTDLEELVLAADPVAFEKSEWRDLVDYLSEPMVSG